MNSDLCKCGNPRRQGGRYCLGCHAQYIRRFRVGYIPTEEERRKSNSRRIANVYQARGKLIPQPCEKCGGVKTQKHHDDYSRPLAVRWLCRPCHLELHRSMKSKAA